MGNSGTEAEDVHLPRSVSSLPCLRQPLRRLAAASSCWATARQRMPLRDGQMPTRRRQSCKSTCCCQGPGPSNACGVVVPDRLPHRFTRPVAARLSRASSGTTTSVSCRAATPTGLRTSRISTCAGRHQRIEMNSRFVADRGPQHSKRSMTDISGWKTGRLHLYSHGMMESSRWMHCTA